MKKLLYILAAALVTGCVYPYNDALKTPDTPVYVFDGNISVGGQASLAISNMYGLQQGVRYVTGKTTPDKWWVEDDNGKKYYPPSPTGKADLSLAPADRKYKMVVEIDGKIYTTALKRPETPPEIDDILFYADDENVYCSASFNTDTGNEYACVGIEEIWEFHTLFIQKIGVDPNSWVYYNVDPVNNPQRYWCWNKIKIDWESTVDLSKTDGRADKLVIHSFSRKDNRNHRNYTIRVRVRTLDREEYLFKKNMETLDQEANSLFTANPGDVTSNIVCETDPSERVLGYVSTSRYNYKEAVLDDRYLIDTVPSLKLLEYVIGGQDIMYHYYFEKEWRPVMMDFMDDAPVKVPYWGPARCVDCTAAGGTLEKPQFSE